MIDRFMVEHMDQLDADLFSGDCLCSEEARTELERMLGRWNRRLAESKEIAAEPQGEPE